MKRGFEKPQKVLIGVLLAVFVVELVLVVDLQITGNPIISKLKGESLRVENEGPESLKFLKNFKELTSLT